MARAPRLLGVSLLVVALAQSAALGKMVYDRVALLRDGREVVLELTPRDPRDLFRGYYSSLNYKISQVPTRLLAPGDAEALVKSGGDWQTRTVYVVLKPDEAGAFQPVSVHLSRPEAPNGEVLARGTVNYWGGENLQVEYGIESYFLPKEEAAALDLKERDTLRIVAAVGPDGEMAIKRLLVNGEPAYEEPPF